MFRALVFGSLMKLKRVGWDGWTDYTSQTVTTVKKRSLLTFPGTDSLGRLCALLKSLLSTNYQNQSGTTVHNGPAVN